MGFLLGLLLSVQQPSVVSVFEESTTSVAAYISSQAPGYEERALYIASRESGLIATSTGDMDILCVRGPNKGKPVRARGIWQITDCYHPEISDTQAFDIVWSTAWAIPKIENEKLCEKEWTECRKKPRRL